MMIGYYLVATYSVMNVLPSFAIFGGGLAERAKPKSQSYVAGCIECHQTGAMETVTTKTWGRE